MHARKLMLTVILGGPIAGTLAGFAVDTDMLPPPEPSWRKAQPDVIFTQAGQALAYDPPEDLGPPLWRESRTALLARRFAADADLLATQPLPAGYTVETPTAEPAASPADHAQHDATRSGMSVEGDTAAEMPESAEDLAPITLPDGIQAAAIS